MTHIKNSQEKAWKANQLKIPKPQAPSRPTCLLVAEVAWQLLQTKYVESPTLLRHRLSTPRSFVCFHGNHAPFLTINTEPTKVNTTYKELLHIRHTHQQHPFLKTLNWLKYKTFSKNFPSPFFLSLFNTSLWRQKMGRFKVMAFLGRFLIGKNSDFFQRDFWRGMANSFDPDLKAWSFKSSRTGFLSYYLLNWAPLV